ncbi:hypothetical protein [Arthrobacter sp. efr-133-R2A-63]|jgi:hypothetical protein|uniref:hypothetical protein n=1 Tax=Arthrobacter sp. efr-133-R2A-63 TaxID=3040278 RepID=UPI00254B4749|nr:hypothetical protein [Arthrobacter sp. efr-133-R2A-63]
MNYLLLALAIASAFVALLYSANIVRVAIGRIVWASNLAHIGHLVIAPTAIVLAIWLFQMAVAA